MRKEVSLATALLLGLLFAPAPGGGSACAQENPFSRGGFFYFQDDFDDPEGIELLAHELTLGLFAAPLWMQKEERHLRAVAKKYSDARRSLITGDGPEFVRAYNYLKRAAAPKSGLTARVRRRVRLYLSRLPDHFVPGYAYTRDDGTSAADPDRSIVLQLIRDRYSIFGDSGDAD